ncbi:conserved hypothetical protein [Gloeothece citriformis PCC 7424]|uniref:Lipopolysaccharide assembly protein A domain-containing protein n=1 Tax=Gloeothece citriformis (strain PCC 7424) TaxID=65393 RepID=B7KGW3_GLOC7|nr:LapA family protein [Gloeothece citriformis]ACK73450.1 conserved hypothetical protein [Gloeothece citriformis PCC 7424]
MDTLTNLIASILIAAWMITLAVFSIQNITPVSLKLFMFETFQLPLGVLLAFCAAGGVVLGALLPLLFARSRRTNRRNIDF